MPGASRDEVAGPLGDRLKVRVRAAPESGKANRAVLRVLSEVLGVAPGTLTIVRGETMPLKTLRIEGLALHDARRKLLGETT